MGMRAAVAIAIGLSLAAGAAACGGGDDTQFSDQKIIEKLNLTKSDDDSAKGYLFGDDFFCQVDKNLLNDADEIEAAAEDKNALVITSREGNVGVVGLPVFPRDCKEAIEKKLGKLDPVPKEG
jgi:hypothetical protein